MALTDEQRLAALEDAYFSGVLEVQYGDKTTKYRSLNDIERAMNALKDRIGGADKAAHLRRRYAEFDKGL